MNRARPLSSPTLHFTKGCVKPENLAKGVLMVFTLYAPQGAEGAERTKDRIFG